MEHIVCLKKFTATKIVILLTIGLIVFSCNDEVLNKDIRSISSIIDPSKVNEAQINNEAKTYYRLLKRAIFATNSNSMQLINSSESNPLVEKLREIEILDENNQTVSFFSLDQNEQIHFLNNWALLEANELTKKIVQNPDIEKHLYNKNMIIQKVLTEEMSPTTKGTTGSGRVKNNSEFFTKIQQSLKTLSENEIKIDVSPKHNTMKKAVNISGQTVKTKLQNFARRGDFLVELGMHGHPYVYINVFDENSKGHAAIINKTISNDDSNDKKFTYAMGYSGFREETIEYWCARNSYIMGIQKVTWKMKFRGLKTGFYKEVTPISNGDLLADNTVKYLGREYVKTEEYMVSKFAAPTRLTCTTIVWWNVKEVYGIDLSSWLLPFVSPSDLYLSENSYVRAVIE